MMITAVRCAALTALLVSATACTDATATHCADFTRRRSPARPARPPVRMPRRGFPAVSRPARVYVAVDWPTYPIHGSPLASRYVLYDDGTFALQYSSANYPFFEYRGTHTEANGLITFNWEGWSSAGPWGATGSLSDDALSVRYNLVMQLSDFEDGVYLRAHDERVSLVAVCSEASSSRPRRAKCVPSASSAWSSSPRLPLDVMRKQIQLLPARQPRPVRRLPASSSAGPMPC